jgi:hypothetical protein
MNKYTHDDKVVDAVMGLMVILWILFGACMLGLTLTIIKAILLAFGIETNL